MKTCENCIHYPICLDIGATRCDNFDDEFSYTTCTMFKDKSKLIELPCYIGDTVYKIYYYRGACNNCDSYADFFGLDPICDENKILFPEINDNNECVCNKHHLKISKYNADLNWIILQLDQFGKTVFLTREEAEKRFEELNGK